MTDLTTEQRATPSSDSTTETGKESSRQSGTVVANGIELFYESRGRTEDPAVLLIMGLGTQMTGWPENFCAQLCGHGFRVIRFDNRDIGLSQKMDGQKAPSPVTQVLAKCRPGKALFGRGVPYTLFDMANDTLGLLDQLGIHEHQRRGQGGEFYQLRDFRSGDNLRQMDWKAVARYQRLITREYREDRDQQVLLMLDCGRRMRHDEQQRGHLDDALDAMLLLAFVALRQGDAVGLLSFGGDQRWFAPRKGQHVINGLLNAVYDLQAR
ncbi:MAG: DUF58 domain-containing protein, partial [Spongiibacter sp.]|nr:DUF58 domain-containing protein [Spongiibacter sp.]